MAKSVALAVVLSIMLSGVGQIYLDRVGRGVAILIAGLALSIGLTWFIGIWGVIPAVAFWIWQIYDAYKIARQSQQLPVQPKIPIRAGSSIH